MVNNLITPIVNPRMMHVYMWYPPDNVLVILIGCNPYVNIEIQFCSVALCTVVTLLFAEVIYTRMVFTPWNWRGW